MSPYRRTLLVVTLIATLVVATTIQATTPTANAEAPRGVRLFMVSDSVGLGSINAVRSTFAGWQVSITGKPGLFTEQLVSYVNNAPSDALGDSAVVATGYNYPYWDRPRFDASIDSMVGALRARGVQRIFWVTMREVKPAFYSNWGGLSPEYRTLYQAYPYANEQLRMATLRHPDLSIIDWASIADQPDITYDAIHLNANGAAKYAGLMAGAILNAPTRRAAGTVTVIPVAGVQGVPTDATAVSLNLTAVHPRTSGYLSVYPCGGEQPVVSNLNYRAAYTVASSTIVPVGADGAVCLFQSSDGHVVVDVTGSFSQESGFVALTPARAIDTRQSLMPSAGQIVPVHLGSVSGAPAGAFTAVVNLTGVANADAELRIFACGTPPSLAPTRSVEAGFAQTLDLLVATDANGDVCVVTNGNVHVLVDLFGAFPAGAPVQPIPTSVILDTRFVGGVVQPLVDRPVQVAGLAGVPLDPLPTGVVLTITAVAPQSNGFVTVFPCSAGSTPTSVLNVVPNHGQANTVIVGLDPGGTACVRSSVLTQVTVDVTGWLGAGHQPLAPARLVDTRL